MKATITTLGLTLYLFFCALPAEGRGGFLGNCCGQAQGQRPACLQKCGNLEINARAIYWRSSFTGEALGENQRADLVDFVVDGITSYMHPRWEWGWGIGATYLFPCGCWNLAVRYVHWKDRYTGFVLEESATTTRLFSPFFGAATFPGNNPATVPLPLASVYGAMTRRYQHLDGEGGYTLLCCPHHLLQIYGGVRYMRFVMRERYVGEVSADQNTINPPDPGTLLFPVQHVATEAVGVRTGFFGMMDLFRDFSLSGHIGLDFLWGHHNQFLIARGTTVTLNPPTNLSPSASEYIYPKFHRFIPGIDGHISLNYQKKFCRCSLQGEFGLEGHYYVDGTMRVVSSSTAYMPIPLVTGFGFGGPYLELSISY